MTSKYWGEIAAPPVPESFIPDVTTEIEKSMDKFCLAEYEDDSDREKVENIVIPPIDPLVSYAISLHKYANDMTEIIRVTELATEMNLMPPDDAVPIPVMPEIDIKHKLNSLNFIPKELTPFSSGFHVEIPELSEVIVNKILKKCIVTMFAHIGYETTHQSVLDVLTDVLESFFQKFCKKVIESLECSENENQSSFPFVIEKVLIETGMGGVKGLYDYHQHRVVNYVNVLKNRCSELNKQYKFLLIPKTQTPATTHNLVRVKVEEDEIAMETDNPEFHFTTFEGNPAVCLEPELQLLEAVENLQSLENTNEEEITSPGIISIPAEGDLCNLSPLSKKKRLK